MGNSLPGSLVETVMVEGVLLNEVDVISGVPQGTTFLYFKVIKQPLNYVYHDQCSTLSHSVTNQSINLNWVYMWSGKRGVVTRD